MADTDNSTFEAMHSRSRAEAFLAANTKRCRKCGVDGPTDRRQHCLKCATVRLGTLEDPNAKAPDYSVPRDETPEQGNRRLAKAMAERAAKVQRPTIGMLITGAPGIAKAKTPVLDWCDQSVSARANLADIVKRLSAIESFLIVNPRNEGAWANYERRWDALDKIAQQINTAEDKIAAAVPGLLREPVVMPPRMEQGRSFDQALPGDAALKPPAWMDIE